MDIEQRKQKNNQLNVETQAIKPNRGVGALILLIFSYVISLLPISLALFWAYILMNDYIKLHNVGCWDAPGGLVIFLPIPGYILGLILFSITKKWHPGATKIGMLIIGISFLLTIIEYILIATLSHCG